MRFDYTPSDLARFWEKVDRNGPIAAHCPELGACWPWTASCRKGYGRLQMGAREAVAAHVMSYEIHHGPVPQGLWVLHYCDNPPCVRPSHIFAGTAGGNSKDRDAKGRNPNAFSARLQPSHYAIGERSRSAKANPAMVREIRARKATGESYSSLERAFPMDRSSLWEIVNRKTWAHVD